MRAEPLESRQLLTAIPLTVGIHYMETDWLESESGFESDELPNRFIVSFLGGAPQTEMTEFRISLDKDQNGLAIGDLIFDTAVGGIGKANAHPFQVSHLQSQSGAVIQVDAEVEDGDTEMTVRLTNFMAGDLLYFTIDVDEVLRMHEDLERFNRSLDVIVSGQEFEDVLFWADFVAPHYEPVTAHALFENDYGDPEREYGLPLPPNEGPPPESFPSRTAAAIAQTTQQPKPVSIAGTIWVDNNLNLRREAGEQPLPGVTVGLYLRDSNGQYVDTGLRQVTDAQGRYHFSTALGLMPGDYQVVQTQPDGFFPVGSVAGSVAGNPVGASASSSVITGIHLPVGDLHAIQYDFAHAQAAGVQGFVYRDDNDNGRRDPGEVGLSGVPMRLEPRETVVPIAAQETITASDGSYAFVDVPPGLYDIIQVTQPVGLDDGRDSPGTVNGVVVGVADDPGDAIRDIFLPGAATGIEYNFGELPRGSISGGVFLAAPGEDCGVHDGGRGTPLPGVEIILLGAHGETIAQTWTDSQGRYRFNDLSKGVYSLIEVTPAGLIDGRAAVGQIRGVTVGHAVNGGLITDIVLPAGADGVRYDFCEAAPAQIAGYVYHDQNQNGKRDLGEHPIENVLLELLDASGTVVAQTRTDSNGHYAFTELLPGSYSIRQQQPAGYLDGLDAAGTIDGNQVGRAINPGDEIVEIVIRQGQRGIDYNFGELLPASLSGRVHVDDNDNCLYDPGELLLEGVTVELLDLAGNVVASTTTDSNGQYHFTGIVPGVYTVVQTQPEAYFPGTARPGSAGGLRESANRIGSIHLGSGEVAVDYDFCEKPPAEISGFVYVDQNNNQRRDPGEAPIPGTRIDLIDSRGQQVATTTTDSLGYYRFTHLPQGTYTLRQTQPQGYLQGSQQAGSAGGDDSQDDFISSIPIAFGSILTQYNFGELLPGFISGYVFVDGNGDCIRQDGEPGLEGVRIDLFDGTGQIVSYTVTDADGYYRFEGIIPGDYEIVQTQPQGYFGGAARVGSGGGQAIGSTIITAIPVEPGDQLVEYNFCQRLPAEISGFVFEDLNLNRRRDRGEQPIAGVTVELRDASGRLLQTTLTGGDGSYRFAGLVPGTYSLHQVQPEGYFHGGQIAGNLGGDASLEDIIDAIVLPSGAVATDYNFPEVPPATISGYVFQDGPALLGIEPPAPEDLRQFRDGMRQPEDQPISGVVLELRNVLGEPFSADRALPGTYPTGPIRVTTGADGYYEFPGLRPGTYHVYQVQPDGFIDGLDTPGTTGGVAVNVADIPADIELQFILQTLIASSETDPGTDAILNVTLTAGAWSRENNFSEIKFEQLPPPPLPQEIPVAEIPAVSMHEFPADQRAVGFATPPAVKPAVYYELVYPVTWHLSVINGGSPRGDQANAGPVVKQASMADDPEFHESRHRKGRWSLFTRTGERLPISDALTLGDESAVPLAGDFNGDGRYQIAIYVDGIWYVDMNGNGRWDQGDLIVKLGNSLDRPVVGDWDGDGKTDVGIFGRQWPRDPEAIVNDPGLPSTANRRFTRPKNVPPNPPEATDGVRKMRRYREELRADLIDHVFRYGEHQDIPIVGDWNGDGIDSIAIYRDGVWVLDEDGDGRLTDRDPVIAFGYPGTIPVVGDWNGDGIDNLGFVDGDLWVLDSDGDRQLSDRDERLRIPTDGPDARPVVGDWDGDGRDQPGYYRTVGAEDDQADEGTSPRAA